MSGCYEVYIKHNLSEERIRRIDSIFLREYVPKEFFEFERVRFQNIGNFASKIEHRKTEIVTLDQIKSQYQNSNYLGLRQWNITEEEWNDELFAPSVKDISWAIQRFRNNKEFSLSHAYFGLTFNHDIFTILFNNIDLDIFEVHNSYKEYFNQLRKFILELAMLFDTSENYKAIYFFDEDPYYEVLTNMFYNYNDFDTIYNFVCTLPNIKASNMPSKDELGKITIKYDSYPIILDDFTDLKELSS